MADVKPVKNTEPVAKTFAWAAAAVLVIINGVALLQVFGVPITEDQGDAVVKVVESLLALGAIVWGTMYARSQVTPVEKVENQVIPAAVNAAIDVSTGVVPGGKVAETAERAGVAAGIQSLNSPPMH